MVEEHMLHYIATVPLWCIVNDREILHPEHWAAALLRDLGTLAPHYLTAHSTRGLGSPPAP